MLNEGLLKVNINSKLVYAKQEIKIPISSEKNPPIGVVQNWPYLLKFRPIWCPNMSICFNNFDSSGIMFNFLNF